jgi:hypothetical protein
LFLPAVLWPQGFVVTQSFVLLNQRCAVSIESRDCCSFSGDAEMAQAVVVGVPKMAAMYSTMITNPTAADAPQLTLLRHNDLQYLANHLLLLPYLFSPQLETLVGGEVWFGDEALRLRAAARSCFNDAVRELLCFCRWFLRGHVQCVRELPVTLHVSTIIPAVYGTGLMK